jgi:hypothetical protein
MALPKMDEDALLAAVELVGRTGGKGFQIGFLHDDVPVAEAGWYAYIQYKGARITVEDKTGPVEAAEALARRLLTGDQCQHCFKLVALEDWGAMAVTETLMNGTEWTHEQQAAAGLCQWRRTGRTWKRGCE